jgi:hypothetical protein
LVPNLIIIGAQKSGTSSLHHYLKWHPDIFMSRIKEPGLFLNPNYNRMREEYASANEIRLGLSDANLMRAMLTFYNGEKVIGEASTHYTKIPEHGSEAPGKCKKINPDMKFIYMLRNPLERIVSQYLFSLRMQYVSLPFYNALKDDCLYLSISLYYFQLKNYLNNFDKSSFKIIIFEEFVSNPVLYLNEIFNFLNISPESYPKTVGFPILNKSKNRESFNKSELKFPKEYFYEIIPKINENVKGIEEFLGRKIDIWDLSEEKWCK